MQHEMINENYHVLTVKKRGKTWEIRVHVDMDDEGGIGVDIVRNEIVCTACGFDWNEQNLNEPQE